MSENITISCINIKIKVSNDKKIDEIIEIFVLSAYTKISIISLIFYLPNPNPNTNLQHIVIFAP